MKNPPDDKPIGLKIAIIDRAFKRRMDERAGSMGLTSVQLRVLGRISLLESAGVLEINQRDLEEAVQVTHPTMTGIIKRLENKGFVTCMPSPTDKRYKKITCTPKGAGVHRELAEQDQEVLLELCHGFTQEDMDTFHRLTSRLLENVSDEHMF